EVRDAVWLGEGADLSPDAEVYGPVLIGDNSRVEAGAVLRPYTVLGADVVVKQMPSWNAASSTITSTSVRARACAARSSAGRATSVTARGLRRTSSSATNASSARTRSSTRQ